MRDGMQTLRMADVAIEKAAHREGLWTCKNRVNAHVIASTEWNQEGFIVLWIEAITKYQASEYGSLHSAVNC